MTRFNMKVFVGQVVIVQQLHTGTVIAIGVVFIVFCLVLAWQGLSEYFSKAEIGRRRRARKSKWSNPASLRRIRDWYSVITAIFVVYIILFFVGYLLGNVENRDLPMFLCTTLPFFICLFMAIYANRKLNTLHSNGSFGEQNISVFENSAENSAPKKRSRIKERIFRNTMPFQNAGSDSRIATQIYSEDSIRPHSQPQSRLIGVKTSILFECCQCNQRLEIESVAAGQNINCPNCGASQDVPTA